MEPYKIVLADDHVLIRQALKEVIDGLPDVKVVGEADDGLKLLELLTKVTPDLIIIDIFMPNLSGMEAIEKIKQIMPTAKIMILTMSKSTEHASRAVAAGIQGYLLKDNAFSDLLAAIKAIRQGRVYLSPTLLGDRLTGKKRSNPLSNREIAILTLFAEGNSRKIIAEILCISHSTVTVHLEHIKEKLKIKNDVDLIKYALQRELISL